MKIKFTLILIFVFSNVALSQLKTTDKGGPPTQEELIGFWKKVDYPTAEKKSKVNPWPQKYQWFAFYENGKIYSMMSDKDYDYGSKELATIFELLTKDTSDYKYKGGMLVITNKNIDGYREVWGVNQFSKDINQYMKTGRLMMTLDDGSGKVIYYRLLERIP